MTDSWVDVDPSTLGGSSSSSSASKSSDGWVDIDPASFAPPKVDTKPQGFWANAGDAISGDVGAVIQAGMDPGQAVSDAGNFLKNLTADQAVKMGFNGLGAAGGAEVGAGIGAAAGAPLMPFTMGLSEPVLTGLGAMGGAGLGLAAANATQNTITNGFDQSPAANQAMVNQAGRDFGTGALFQGAGDATAGVGNYAAAKATKLADALDNSALGLRQGEITRSAVNQGMDAMGGTKPTDAVQTALDLGITKNGTSPLQLKNTADEIHGDLNRQVSDVIAKADDVRNAALGGLPIYPKFTAAQRFIDNPNEVSVTERPDLVKQLDDFRTALKDRSDGSVQFLQSQKKALYRNSYGDGIGAKNKYDLDKAIGNDLKTTIEAVTDHTLPSEQASLVKNLNQKIGAFEELKQPLARSAAGNQSLNPLSSALKSVATTGGVGTAILSSAYTGNPLYALGGFGARAALDAASTPTGKLLMSNALDAGSAVQSALPASEAITAPLSAIMTDEMQERNSPKLSTQRQQRAQNEALIPLFKKLQTLGLFGDTPNDSTDSKDNHLFFSAPQTNSPMSSNTSTSGVDPKVIAAMRVQEDAKNDPSIVSKTGAVGLMQIEPDTAKEIASDLGIKNYDLTDPATNIKFGTHYIGKLLSKYDGDLPLALTAYNQGEGRVDNLINEYGPTLDDIKPFLGPVGKIYASSILKRAGLS